MCFNALKKASVVLMVVFILSMLVTGMTFKSTEKSSDTVYIPDPYLEKTVRDALDMPEGDISTKAMLTLHELYAGGRGIKDLTGLEYAGYLGRLFLNDNRLQDISLLVGLKNLEYVDVRLNDLDTSAGSGTLRQIQQLMNAGTKVEYEPQKTAPEQ